MQIFSLNFLIILFLLVSNFSYARPLKGQPIKIGIILFNDLDQLDVVAPYEIFSDFPNTKVYFISNTLDSIKSTRGLQFTPDFTFKNSPQFNVLFVPGGGGITEAVSKNKELIEFIQKQSEHANYLSSVCTGALILGYAGQLKGYRATTHWLAKKYLKDFGAIPEDKRVVVDRNRITGAGVTSGIDVALKLADLLFGKDFVEKEELFIEYTNPKPLYPITPNSAPQTIIDEIKKEMEETIKKRDQVF